MVRGRSSDSEVLSEELDDDELEDELDEGPDKLKSRDSSLEELLLLDG